MKKKKNIILLCILCVAILAGLISYSVVYRKKANVNTLVHSLCVNSIDDIQTKPFGSDIRDKDYPKLSNSKMFHNAVNEIMDSLANPFEEEDTTLVPENIDHAINLYSNLNFLGYDVKDFTPALENFIIEKLSYYCANGKFNRAVELISYLDDHQIQSEKIRSSFLELLKTVQKDVFSNNGTLSLESYISDIIRYLSYSYYIATTTASDCFPYDEMVKFIKTYGELVVPTSGVGGFYDGKEKEFIDKSYWVDPLAKKSIPSGEIGTYRYTEEHTLFGDFRITTKSETWYQTPASDPNNSRYTRVYYKDEIIGIKGQYIAGFFEMVNNENCYYMDGELYILEKDEIITTAGDNIIIVYN